MERTTDTFVINIEGTLISVMIDANKRLDDPGVVKLLLKSEAEKYIENHKAMGYNVEVANLTKAGSTFYAGEKRLLKSLEVDKNEGVKTNHA